MTRSSSCVDSPGNFAGSWQCGRQTAQTRYRALSRTEAGSVALDLRTPVCNLGVPSYPLSPELACCESTAVKSKAVVRIYMQNSTLLSAHFR